MRDGDRVVDHRMCLVPRSDYEIVDDWHVLGMRATGSKSVRANEVFVPEHRALCMYLARGGSDFPGASLNPGAVYRVPISGLSSHCLAGAGVGNAQGALEQTIAAIKERSTSYTAMRMRDFQAVQLRVARAGATIDAARLAVRALTDHPVEYGAGLGSPGVAYADLRRGVPAWVTAAVPEVDALLISPHWGPNMNPEPLPYVREAAAALLDRGATLVAGHSAHVFQGVAQRVLYDLGDFLDDYRVDPRPATGSRRSR